MPTECMTTLDSANKAAIHYIGQGYSPIPLPSGFKKPTRPGWQKLEIGIDDVPRYFTNGQNIGLLMGAPSGGLVCLDLDRPEALTVADLLLPKTRTGGRESRPRGHRFYEVEGELPKTTRYDLKSGEDRRMLELLSTGAQVVVAPSIHPRGERYLQGDSPITKISTKKLLELGEDVALASGLVFYYPELGIRHDYVLAATGYLGRRLPEERVTRIVEAAVIASGDDEAQDRKSDIRSTLERLARKEEVTGGVKLDELTPGLVGLLEKWGGFKAKERSRFGSNGGRISLDEVLDRDSAPYPLSDLGNAERLVARHGAGLRYCHNWGKWLVWDERRWVVDDTGAVRQMARQTVRSIYEEASGAADETQRKAVAKWAMSSEAKTRIDAMVGLAEAELGIPVTPDKLDADPWLLNVLNGTIDLHSGELRGHQREELITKLAPVEYDPEASAPTWQTFLEHVQPNEQVRGFLKRSAGYSATGDTSEQCMFIDSGSGANGKSTYHEALHATLGDYAMRTPAETLLAKRAGGVPNDIARLKGARLVTASETDEGRRLNESLIKDLTGQDTISARFMRAEWFDFTPTHKLHLATNHKPEIRGTDPAIWRRIRLIPWAVTIPPSKQDRRLPEKLKAERSGVLRWLVEGAREWAQEGLNAPDEVRLATNEYRADQDVLAAFLEDCCVVDHYETGFAGKLWKAWHRWCEENGETAGTQKRFGTKLKERGFKNDRDGVTRRKVWYGIALRPDWEERAELDHEKKIEFAGGPGGTKTTRNHS